MMRSTARVPPPLGPAIHVQVDVIEIFRDSLQLFWADKYTWIIGCSCLLMIRILWATIFSHLSSGVAYSMAVDGYLDLRLVTLDILLDLFGGVISAPTLAGAWFAGMTVAMDRSLSISHFFQAFSSEFFPRIYGLYVLELLVDLVLRHTVAVVFGFWAEALIVIFLCFLAWFSVPVFIRWEDTPLGEAISLSARRIMTFRIIVAVISVILISGSLVVLGVLALVVGVVLTLPIAAIANSLLFRQLFDGIDAGLSRQHQEQDEEGEGSGDPFERPVMI